MRALGSVLLVILAALGGLMAWNTLDVALGGPGAAARGLLPVPALRSPGSASEVPGLPVAELPETSVSHSQETLGQKVARITRHALIYEVNGWLTILYFLADNIAAVVALLMGGTAALLERRASVPQRAFTGIVLAATVVAALSVPSPIPVILAVMWLFVPLVLILDPAAGQSLAWRAKSGILLYAGAAVAYILYSRLTEGIPAEAWAALAGGVEEARAVMAQSRAYVATMANIALWFVLPLGYVSLMAQALLAHPMPSAPFRTVAERVRLIRTRGVE